MHDCQLDILKKDNSLEKALIKPISFHITLFAIFLKDTNELDKYIYIYILYIHRKIKKNKQFLSKSNSKTN